MYSISLIVKKVSARDLMAFGRDFTEKIFFCNYTLWINIITDILLSLFDFGDDELKLWICNYITILLTISHEMKKAYKSKEKEIKI